MNKITEDPIESDDCISRAWHMGNRELFQAPGAWLGTKLPEPDLSM
jgi:hypothetical protein